MKVEAFVNRYHKCGTCGYKLHEYMYAYVSRTKTARDLTRCIPCKGEPE